MFTTVCSAAVYGLQAYLVRVEVDLAGGLPSFQLVGSLGSEVKESRERVSVAMKNSGFQIPPAHITVIWLRQVDVKMVPPLICL